MCLEKKYLNIPLKVSLNRIIYLKDQNENTYLTLEMTLDKEKHSLLQINLFKIKECNISVIPKGEFKICLEIMENNYYKNTKWWILDRIGDKISIFAEEIEIKEIKKYTELENYVFQPIREYNLSNYTITHFYYEFNHDISNFVITFHNNNGELNYYFKNTTSIYLPKINNEIIKSDIKIYLNSNKKTNSLSTWLVGIPSDEQEKDYYYHGSNNLFFSCKNICLLDN